MRKFLGLIFLLLFVTFSVVFFFTLNFRLGLYSPDKVKSLARESGVYELASGVIKENLVKATGSSIDAGPFLEIITDAVSVENLTNFSEQAIDNLFLALKDPKANPQIVIPTSELGDQIKTIAAQKFGMDISEVSLGDLSETPLQMLEKDQTIDLNQNPLVLALAQIQTVVISLGVAVLVLAILLFVVPGETASSRFAWLGTGFLLVGLVSLLVVGFDLKILPNLVDQLIASANFSDQKIVVGIKKVITLIIDNQQIYFIIETASSLVLGILFIIVGRSVRVENLDLLKDDQPEKEVGKI